MQAGLSWAQQPEALPELHISDRSLRVQAELVKLLFRNFNQQFISLIIIAPIVVPVMWNHVPRGWLLLWGAAYMCSLLERRWLARRFFKLRPPPEAARTWGYRFARRAMLGGALIGSCGLWMFTTESLPHLVFVFAFLFVTAAGAPTIYSSFLPAHFMYLPMVTLPLAFRIMAEGGATGVWGSVAILIFLVTLLRTGRDHHETTRRNLVLRFENQDLVIELSNKKEEAEAANRAKSNFLAAASHDLRQPMQTLSFLAASLDLRLKNSPERETVKRISMSVEALEELFDALLDISKLDAAVIQAHPEPVALGPLFAKLEVEFAPVAEAKGLRLRVVPSSAWIQTDPMLLARVLQNLIGNAIRYTQHGSVMLMARRKGRDGIAIEVRDSGVGVASEHQTRIFEEYYQVGNPERDRRKGLGLGLAIVKRIVGLLGHRLELRSGPGAGSVFSLLVSRVDTFPAAQQARTAAVSSVAGHRILVIDDNPEVCTSLAELLHTWGCEVVTATSEREAAEKSTGRLPDLMLVDYRLRDGRTGIQAVSGLRSHFAQEIPAILLTGDTGPDVLRAATAAYLPLLHKPVRAAGLQELISQSLITAVH